MKNLNKLLNCFGTSLIEMMTTLALLAIICHLALFHFQPLLVKNRLDNHTAKVNRALGLSRLNAIAYNSNITLCGLANNKCDQQLWHKEITVFTDSNDIGVLDGTDTALFTIESTHQQDMLTYPRRSVTFRNDGTPMGFNNGTFIFCPEYKKANLDGLAISVSYTGRIRTKDTKKCQK
ncbi:pilus assembly protein [Pseudoalteromonas sp. NEC-BIFX-2020_002]|uniref:Type II secretion system protein H n=1 Tax=Pseudoalteromonas neustonica TaxID=1840331 RepID=A0ABU9TZ05_9GAMM|nr:MULTISPECIES: GspH/FimT family pseudopilin [unclassified Pseudoalteromonas]NMR27725.1 pilus assembly protein [Pseudoalteromonas sp. NEC-BIFX-2020_015]NNG43879.1 pilus assembly protein [Pseudoalteromonas sp. NEC-BIFX-2020_002]